MKWAFSLIKKGYPPPFALQSRKFAPPGRNRKLRPCILRPSAPWISDDNRQSKRDMRHAECTWIKHRLNVHYEIYREKKRRHNNLLRSARSSYVSTKVVDCKGDSKKLFSLVSALMGNTSPKQHQRGTPTPMFYASKVARIRSGLDAAADAAGLSPIQQHIPSPVADSPG